MKAHDLLMETTSPSKLPIAHSSHGTWYEVTAGQVKSWYKTHVGPPPNLDKSPNTRYFMHVGNSSKMSYSDTRLVWLRGLQLGSVINSSEFHTTQDGQALQALAHVTGAQQGERVWGDFILYDGQVYLRDAFIHTLPVVAQISTGAVHEVPTNARWTLARIYLKYLVSADRVVVFRNTSDDVSQPWSSASIKSGELVNTQSQRKLDAATQVKLSKELTQALGLQQKVSVSTHIVPNSKLQRVLQAIQDNPGVTRWPLYLSVLKLRQVPAQSSADDAVHELMQMTLISNVNPVLDHAAKYVITPVGKLVLARLNAGHAVAKASLIK